MYTRLFLLLLLLSGLAGSTVTAQTREDDARSDLRYGNRGGQQTFAEGGDIWYGAGLILDYQSRLNRSLFRIGITPIIGYKLNNFLSVGPRGSVIYNAFGADSQQGRLTSRHWDYSIGAFTRARVWRGIFAQAEYSLLSDVLLTSVDPQTNRFNQIRQTRGVPFLGAGFSQGGGPNALGFEISVMFRLTQPDRLNDSSFEIRTGMNYNF